MLPIPQFIDAQSPTANWILKINLRETIALLDLLNQLTQCYKLNGELVVRHRSVSNQLVAEIDRGKLSCFLVLADQEGCETMVLICGQAVENYFAINALLQNSKLSSQSPP